MRGSSEQARAYAFKEGPKHAEKRDCVITEDGREEGEAPAPGTRSDLHDFISAADSGVVWRRLLRDHPGVASKYLSWAKEVTKTRKRALPGVVHIDDLEGKVRKIVDQWARDWLRLWEAGRTAPRNVGFISGVAHGSQKSTSANQLAIALTNMGYNVLLLSGKETLANVLNMYEEGRTPIIIFDLPKAATHMLKRTMVQGWGGQSIEEEWQAEVKPALVSLIENLSDGGLRTSTKYTGANVFINSLVLVFTNLSMEEIQLRWPNRGMFYDIESGLIESASYPDPGPASSDGEEEPE